MTTNERWAAEDESRIDRLVDGELDDAERRALLTQFDVEPDGWRRCALAFLEAQAWREAVHPVTHAVSTQRLEAAAKTTGAMRGDALSRPKRTLRFLAPLAAACLALFSLGWLSADGFRAIRSPGAKPTSIVKARVPDNVPRPVRETTPSSPDAGSVVASRQTSPASSVVRQTRESPRLASGAAPLPDAVLRGLEQRGIQVETRRGVVRLPLRDGRYVAVPVGAMKLRFVGNRTI
jgi:hypothetical protein